MKKRVYFTAATAGLLGLLVGLNGCANNDDNHQHNHNHHSHDHGHENEKAYLANQGIFDNQEVKNRTLADWRGSWQSVYDYLLAGDLDPVLKAKAKANKNKTFDEYKTYYTQGYATDIQKIVINSNNKIDFYQGKVRSSCQYQYSGYKILTYTSGKKGVRYLFTCKNGDANAPRYIQFSDHIIEPTKAGHYHLYMGTQSHEELFKQMDNWPTYFPSSLSKEEIIHDMLSH